MELGKRSRHETKGLPCGTTSTEEFGHRAAASPVYPKPNSVQHQHTQVDVRGGIVGPWVRGRPSAQPSLLANVA